MIDDFDTVALQISLKSEKHSPSDLAFVSEAVEGIVCSSVWAAIAEDRESKDKNIVSAGRIVKEASRNDKGRRRFFPNFGSSSFDIQRNRPGPIRTLADADDLDPFDPLDLGTSVGLNTWLRKTLQDKDVELHSRLFSFANISRLEHRSPLILELAVAIGAATFTPVILTYGIMRAVTRCRRLRLEEKLREREVNLKEEELKQRRLQTEILDSIRAAVKDRVSDHSLKIPDGVLVAAATISSPIVAELGTSPLIGSVTLGLSTKVDH